MLSKICLRILLTSFLNKQIRLTASTRNLFAHWTCSVVAWVYLLVLATVTRFLTNHHAVLVLNNILTISELWTLISSRILTHSLLLNTRLYTCIRGIFCVVSTLIFRNHATAILLLLSWTQRTVALSYGIVPLLLLLIIHKSDKPLWIFKNG